MLTQARQIDDVIDLVYERGDAHRLVPVMFANGQGLDVRRLVAPLLEENRGRTVLLDNGEKPLVESPMTSIIFS